MTFARPSLAGVASAVAPHGAPQLSPIATDTLLGLAGVDLDPTRLGFVVSRNRELQRAVPQIRIDLRSIEGGPQRERPRKMRLMHICVQQTYVGATASASM